MFCSDPKRSAQLGVRKLRGQFEVLKADFLSRPLIPGKQHGELEGRDLKVVLAHLVLKGDLNKQQKDLKKVETWGIKLGHIRSLLYSRCRWT